MHYRFITLCLIFITTMLFRASGQVNTLTLNIDSANTKITKLLYGGLLENWGRDIYTGLYVGRNSPIANTLGMRNDIIEGFKECGLGILEFPGGCFADAYNWRDGIGPVASRPLGEIDTASFKGNGMGTDEYMELCKLANLEPYICVNTNNGTTQQMVDWMNYINASTAHPEWYCKYWSLGNEPWGCGGNLTVTQYADRYLQFRNAIPNIAGKPVVSISANGYGFDRPWLDTMMRRCGSRMDGINGHYYAVVDWNVKGPSYNFNNYQYIQVLQKASDIITIVGQIDGIMDAYDPTNKVGLMFNEWGAWYDQIANQGFTFCQSTLRDAIVAAIHLNTFNNYCERLPMACSAQPVNVIQALFLTNRLDQRQMVKTPVFYTYKLFKPHQNARKIPINLQTGKFIKDTLNVHYEMPLLTASASIDSAACVSITVSNMHLTASQSLAVSLKTDKTYRQVSGQIITAAAATALNEFGKTEQVNIQPWTASNFTLTGKTLSVNLPPKSVVLLRIDTNAVAGAVSQLKTMLPGLSIAAAPQGGIVMNIPAGGCDPFSVQLCGINGRIIDRLSVKAGQMSGSRVTWRPRNAAGGVYLLRVSANGAETMRQIILTK